MARLWTSTLRLAVVAIMGLMMSTSAWANTFEVLNYNNDGNLILSGRSYNIYDTSPDGRYLLVRTPTRITTNDLNSYDDMYVLDRSTGIWELVSLTQDGGSLNAGVHSADMTSDARYIVFDTVASNVVPGDMPADSYGGDIFLRDRVAGTTKLISHAKDSSIPKNRCSDPYITDDGKYIIFNGPIQIVVPNYVSGFGYEIIYDVNKGYPYSFLSDSRMQTSSLSNDNRTAIIEFYWSKSYAKVLSFDLIDRVVKKNVECIDCWIYGASPDGRYVGVGTPISHDPRDIDNKMDAYLLDMNTGEFELLDITADGDSGNKDSGFPGMFSRSLFMSSDNRYVVFVSYSDELVPGFTTTFMQKPTTQVPILDVFVRDRMLGTNTRVTIAPDGSDPLDITQRAYINPDGRYVYLASQANNLAPGLSSYTNLLLAWPGGPWRPANEAPAADAGADQTVECVGPSGSSVVLDGSASTDLDGDTLTYTWTGSFGSASGPSPTLTLPLGVHDITLTVDDGNGGSASDTMTVTVADTVAASTSAMISGTMGNAGWYVSPVTVTLSSTDSCSGAGSITYDLNGTPVTVPGSSATITLTDGIHSLSFASTDAAGNAEASKQITANVDATAPVITISGVTAGATYVIGVSVPTASATAVDALSGLAGMTDVLTGGDGFGLGAFAYSVTATDVAGNVAQTTAGYTVIATGDGLLALIRMFVAQGLIAPELEQSLTQKVLNSMAAKNPVAADNLLQALTNEIQAHTGGKIDAGASAILINAINYVIAHN